VLRFLTDQDFREPIVAGLRRREPRVDVVSVRAFGAQRLHDRDVLALAAVHGRVLLTHDGRTMPTFAYERMEAGQPMPGVVVVPQTMSFGAAIENLLAIVVEMLDGQLNYSVVRLAT
jgi:hypothetical protein